MSIISKHFAEVSFRSFNYFDLVVVAIILLLGLKGIINGFFKEIFGLVGIIGGIFIASRSGDEVGQYLSDNLFAFDNSSAVSFTGFLATLVAFWLVMIVLGTIFKKLSSASGLGIVDKLLGFVFGASKFFLITAVIAHALYNIAALRPSIDSFMNNSKLFPAFVATGSIIMKLDPVKISQDINTTIDMGSEIIQEKTQEIIDEKSQEIITKAKDQIKKQFDDNDKIKDMLKTEEE